MLEGTHPVGQALERGDLAAAYAELCRLNDDPDARPYPERTFIRAGRFTVQSFDRAAKGLLEKFAQSPCLPTGLSPEEFKTALLGAPDFCGASMALCSPSWRCAPPRAGRYLTAPSPSPTVDLAPAPFVRSSAAPSAGCSRCCAQSSGRQRWSPTSRRGWPNTRATPSTPLTSERWPLAATTLAARRHNDVDLENFCCEAKRHCTIFVGRGKKRSLDSVPGHEQDLSLKKCVVDAALGRT